jgi:hypothetical protein
MSVERYLDLFIKLELDRPLSDAEESRRAEELSDLWWTLSADEHAQIEAWHVSQPKAPALLDLEDIEPGALGVRRTVKGECMNFGDAITLLKQGKRVARTGWNGKGMWLRYVDLYSDKEFKVREIDPCVGTWLPFIVMKTADNKLVPWFASQTDVLANDWILVDDVG